MLSGRQDNPLLTSPSSGQSPRSVMAAEASLESHAGTPGKPSHASRTRSRSVRHGLRARPLQPKGIQDANASQPTAQATGSGPGNRDGYFLCRRYHRLSNMGSILNRQRQRQPRPCQVIGGTGSGGRHERSPCRRGAWIKRPSNQTDVRKAQRDSVNTGNQKVRRTRWVRVRQQSGRWHASQQPELRNE